MVLAVLQARLGLDSSAEDVYVSTVGGARTTEPAIDLAIAIAVASAMKNQPAREGLIAVGEVGLTGEVRASVGVQRRLQEAARLGFTRAIVPATGSEELKVVDGIKILPVSDLLGALRVALP